MAPAVGPLRACVLRDERHRVGIASRKVAACPGLAGKQGKALRIAFAGGEGIAEADHQTVPWRNRYARRRSVRRSPRDSRLTGDGLRLGWDWRERRCGARGNRRRPLSSPPEARAVSRRRTSLGPSSARTAPAKLHWHDCPAAGVGIKYADDPSGRAHIVAPYGAAAVQPLDRIPACLRRSRQGGLARRAGTLADKEACPTAPIEFLLRDRRRPPSCALSCSTS